MVSTKMINTVVVDVPRIKAHPKYRKRVRLNTRYKAHNLLPDISVGDRVKIEETRPISKDKRWIVREKISTAHSPKSSEPETPLIV